MINSDQIAMELNSSSSIRFDIMDKDIVYNLDSPIPRRDEFIDHTLLAPEYIRDSNNFIMDLIDNPCAYHRTVSSTTTNSGNTFLVRDSITGELNFHSPIFQYTNKTNFIPTTNVLVNSFPAVMDSALNLTENVPLGIPESEATLPQKQNHEFITFNADFLSPADNICAPQNNNVMENNTVQQYATLSLLPPQNIEINTSEVLRSDEVRESNTIQQYPTIALLSTQTIELSDSEVLQSEEVRKNNTTVQQYPTLSILSSQPIDLSDSEALQREELRDNNPVQQYSAISLISTKSNKDSDVLHNDKLAIKRTPRTKKKLPHKKRITRKMKGTQNGLESDLSTVLDHANDKMAVQMQFNCEICGHCSISQLEFFSHLKQHYEPNVTGNINVPAMTNLTPINNCDDISLLNKKADSSNADSVFGGVNLSFDDFSNVDATVQSVMNHIQDEANQTSSTSIVPDEVEFSETEDMLEGIRNVVDKVSIEDSSNDIDLMASPDLRNTWFSNNFSGISFKSKALGEVSLSEPPMQMMGSDTNDAPIVGKDEIATKLGEDSNLQLFSNDNCLDKAVFEDDCRNMGEPTNLYLTDDELGIMNVGPIDENELATISVIPPENIKHKKQHFEQEKETITAQVTERALENEQEKEKKSNTPKTRKKSLKSKRKRKIRSAATLSEDGDTQDLEIDSCSEEIFKENKQWICSKCTRGFNSSNALKYHFRTHTGVRPHQCDVCGKSFFAQGALKSHLLTHTGDKPFECEHCQRKFRQWGDLKYHVISIHTDEKTHQCEFCGKSFSRKYSLVLHRRIHTSERNYKCEFCTKTFRASTYLQNHRKIHTGEKPHECKVCLKKFRVSGDLNRHKRIHLRKTTKSEDETSDAVQDA